jgi:DNA-binding Lrp family transcriptional regulator
MALAYALVNVLRGQEAAAHQALTGIPGVVEVAPVLGEFDLVCKVEAQTYDDLATIISRFVRSTPGVARTQTLTANAALA